jgi:hypothetical protein
VERRLRRQPVSEFVAQPRQVEVVTDVDRSADVPIVWPLAIRSMMDSPSGEGHDAAAPL